MRPGPTRAGPAGIRDGWYGNGWYWDPWFDAYTFIPGRRNLLRPVRLGLLLPVVGVWSAVLRLRLRLRQQVTTIISDQATILFTPLVVALPGSLGMPTTFVAAWAAAVSVASAVMAVSIGVAEELSAAVAEAVSAAVAEAVSTAAAEGTAVSIHSRHECCAQVRG